jgi:hypothetical protein
MLGHRGQRLKERVLEAGEASPVDHIQSSVKLHFGALVADLLRDREAP